MFLLNTEHNLHVHPYPWLLENSKVKINPRNKFWFYPKERKGKERKGKNKLETDTNYQIGGPN